MRWLGVLIAVLALILPTTASAEPCGASPLLTSLAELQWMETPPSPASVGNARSYFFVHQPRRCGRVEATFGGESRDIPAARRRLIEAFLQLSGGDRAHAGLYQREILFRSRGGEYWLPMQANAAHELSLQRRTGDLVELEVALLGGHGFRGAVDWVFIVEDFNRLPPQPH